MANKGVFFAHIEFEHPVHHMFEIIRGDRGHDFEYHHCQQIVKFILDNFNQCTGRNYRSPKVADPGCCTGFQ